MSTAAEIKSALPNLSTQELKEIEHAVHNLYRTRNVGIIYDDAYGLWTEDDQSAAAAQAFLLMDEQEARHEQNKAG
jgi:hypothetical protein